MNTSVNIHGVAKAEIDVISAGPTAPTYWVSLELTNAGDGYHRLCFFIAETDFARYRRAATAFNAALAELATQAEE